MSNRASKIFLGVGNVLKHDDGAGVRAAEIMMNLSLPDDIEVYDAGSGGLELACVLEKRQLVVVVDAIQADQEYGAVFRISPEQLRPYSNSGYSLHDLHFLDALEELNLLGTSPEQVVVFAIQVADVTTGLGLSAPVETGVDLAIRLACEEFGLMNVISEHRLIKSAWRTG